MAGRDLSAELFGASPSTAPTPGSGRDLSAELFSSATPDRGWSDVPMDALKNLPASAGNFLGGIYQSVRHPLDTLGNTVKLGIGTVRNALPQSVVSAIDSMDPNPAHRAALQKTEDVSDAANKFFVNRYGSTDSLKNTLATDPVGAASDLSTVLGLSGGVANLGSKAATLTGIPGASALSSAGSMLGNASLLTNPMTAATKAASVAAPLIGRGAAVLTGLATHTGEEPIKQAFRSGMQGGQSARQFADNMRGNVPITDVLDSAKQNIAAMGQAKSDAYRQGIAQVSNDKSVLGFSGIDKAVNDAFNAVTFKGQVKNTKAAQVQQAIADAIGEWKALDPAEYHTPEGLDALKQKIGGIVDSIPFEEKTANMVGSKIYNAVKQEIVNQAPTYADTMKGYSEATEQIREIERALSLGKNASVDTAMRKLQSLTRNNVNTNYGNRLNMAKQMEQQGGQQIMPALAGQALSSIMPRGLGNAVAGGLGLGSYALGGPMAAIPALAVQSPRLMGEAALAAGKGAGAVSKAANAAPMALDPAFLNYLYQVGRLPQQP